MRKIEIDAKCKTIKIKEEADNILLNQKEVPLKVVKFQSEQNIKKIPKKFSYYKKNINFSKFISLR